MVPLLGAPQVRRRSLGTLGSQPNEHRMPVPNRIPVLLGSAAHLDTRDPVGLGAGPPLC